MAGTVRADLAQGLPGSRRVALAPRTCPCLTAAERILCIEASESSGWLNMCPFLYGVRVMHGGMIADLRCPTELLSWLTFPRAGEREYQCLCLRKESANTAAGAHLRD